MVKEKAVKREVDWKRCRRTQKAKEDKTVKRRRAKGSRRIAVAKGGEEGRGNINRHWKKKRKAL